MDRKKFDLMVYMIPDYFKTKIKIPAIQREDTAWSEEQKQILIDSLYNDFDIPKIYLRKNPNDSAVWWLIDGQQRLTAIKQFLDGELPIGESSSMPKHLHGKTIKSLEKEKLLDDKEKITGRILDCIIVDCSDDEEEDMFIRLNNGTPLSAAEKRNAIRGEFRDSVKSLIDHKFFSSKIAFNPNRFAIDAVVAQICTVCLVGGATDTKGKTLKKLYEQFKSSYPQRKPTETKIKSILNLMNQIFPHQEPYMKKYNVLSVFLFLLELKDNYAVSSITPKDFYKFFTEFETARQRNSQLSEDDPKFDFDLQKYFFACVNSPDSETGIRERHEVLLKKFFLKNPTVEPKDNTRSFSNAQKEAIYFLNGRRCATVKGIRCPFESETVPFKDCEFDHIKEHNEGGKTTVANGQILCATCHQYKTTEYNKKK